MNLHKTVLLTCIATLSMLCSCTMDDLESPASPVEIRISAGLAAETIIPGSIDKNGIVTGKPLELSLVRIDQTSDTDPTYLPYTQQNNSKTNIGQAPRPARLVGENGKALLEFVTPQAYLTRQNNNKTKLIGWYPPVADGGSTWQVNDAGDAYVGFKVDGETDILMSNLVEGDLTSRYDKSNNAPVFDHLLTRICVRIYTSDDEAKKKWGGVESITIKDMPKTCLVVMPGVEEPTNTVVDQIVFGSPEPMSLICKDPQDNSAIAGYDLKGGLPIPITEAFAEDPQLPVTSSLAGYVMCAPIARDETLEFIIETSAGGTATASAPLWLNAFEPGHSYTVYLNFTPSAIEVTGATIQKWYQGGTSDQGEIMNEVLAHQINHDGDANCFIVPTRQMIKFPLSRPVNEIGTAKNTDGFTLELLWDDAGGAVAEYKVEGSGSNAIVTVITGKKQGNALLAAKVNNVIVWSYHIWVVNNVYYGLPIDRLLGATSNKLPTSVTDIASCGLLYQWGRKDPFPGTRSLYGWAEPDFWKQDNSVQGLEDVYTAIKNPTVMCNGRTTYTGHTTKGTWATADPLSNPCPKGYVVGGDKIADIKSSNVWGVITGETAVPFFGDWNPEYGPGSSGILGCIWLCDEHYYDTFYSTTTPVAYCSEIYKIGFSFDGKPSYRSTHTNKHICQGVRCVLETP